MATDLDKDLFAQLRLAQQTLDAGFGSLPPTQAPAFSDEAAAILHRLAERLHNNYPYAHPLYAGQMLKPPHPIARAAYTLAMSVNPNNHALDGGRATSAMEVEAVAALAKMFGYPQHLGHLSSGGTFANLEALWVAGQLTRTPDGTPRAIAASEQAHYTHNRISAVLGLPFVSIASDAQGRMDLVALEQALQENNIGTVVATLGTTAIGAVDPLHEILKLQQRYNFRIHVDAAYGGYFTLANNLNPATRAAFDAIPHSDSIVVDPHKHGLQPYGCGSVLFRDPAVGTLYKHDSPYTYFSSKDLHLGEISLECSRAGAAAAALWATQQLLPCEPGGNFALDLESSRRAAHNLHLRLQEEDEFIVPSFAPELDIVFWAIRGKNVEESSRKAQNIFHAAEKNGLYVALAKLPTRFFAAGTWIASPHQSRENHETVTCLRSVLMKPEHLSWLDEIWSRLQLASTHL